MFERPRHARKPAARFGAVYTVRGLDWQAAGTRPVARLFGRHHHRHLPAFSARRLLDLGDLIEPVLDAHQHDHAELLVRHLATAETHDDFHLVAFLDEFEHLTHLDVVVVVVDARPKLDLLDVDDLLLFLRFCSSYLNLPKSRILQTGGLACGATSTRSRPASWARVRASCRVTTPTMLPRSSTRRRRAAAISSLTRGPSCAAAARCATAGGSLGGMKHLQHAPYLSKKWAPRMARLPRLSI